MTKQKVWSQMLIAAPAVALLMLGGPGAAFAAKTVTTETETAHKASQEASSSAAQKSDREGVSDPESGAGESSSRARANAELAGGHIRVSSMNPSGHTGMVVALNPRHIHGPGCGHDRVRHGDHIDYVVNGRLLHRHGDHYDDHGPVRLLEGDDEGRVPASGSRAPRQVCPAPVRGGWFF